MQEEFEDRERQVIWLPYASYPATVVALSDAHLAETYSGLLALARTYNGRQRANTLAADLVRWHDLFYEHQDSFFTFGLYACLEMRNRKIGDADKRHQHLWQGYWQNKRKFRRFIAHPDWPEDFHESMREALLQQDWDRYSEVFQAEDEPFGEVAIQWPEAS